VGPPLFKEFVMPEWTDYQAAADKAKRWAAALDRQGRSEDALLMRLLAEAAAEKAAGMAVTAIAEAPAQRDSRDTGGGPPCSLCGLEGDLDAGGLTATCLNPDCCRFMHAVAIDRF